LLDLPDLSALYDFVVSLMPPKSKVSPKKQKKKAKKAAPQAASRRDRTRTLMTPKPMASILSSTISGSRAVAVRSPPAYRNLRRPFFTGPTSRRVLSTGNTVEVSMESAPTAVSQLGMNRELSLHTLPNGNLVVNYCLPLCDVTSPSPTDEGGTSVGFGPALVGTDALGASAVHYGGTLLLNPIVSVAVTYNSTTATAAMIAPTSPHVGLQALAFSKYRVTRLGFSYQPQGQTFQESAPTLGESRLRFAYTSDPSHPVLGTLAYRGTGTIDYSVLTETPNSVQFSEWNAWKMDINDVKTDWLYINASRFTPQAVSQLVESELRQEYYGAVSLYDSYGNGVGSDCVHMAHGQLWTHGTMEFSDPSPLLFTIVPPQISKAVSQLAGMMARSSLSDSESKEEKRDDSDEEPEWQEERRIRKSVKVTMATAAPPPPLVVDIEDISPPKWTPVPSSSLGSPEYLVPTKSSSTLGAPEHLVPSKKGKAK